MSDSTAAPFWLQITEPGRSPRVVTLAGPVEVGRDCEDIVLDDPTTSRRHLVLDPAGDGVVVTDQGSANGTFVDGERITDPVVLGPGHVVRLGETELRIVQGRATTGTAGTADASEPAVSHQRASSAARDLNRAAGKGGLRGFRKG
ncbi:MAG: FHA domain-containing protein [Acidimicrobiia bacterium]|nr:FHA domain-containing protein [Acidimicrobiia bacterium]